MCAASLLLRAEPVPRPQLVSSVGPCVTPITRQTHSIDEANTPDVNLTSLEAALPKEAFAPAKGPAQQAHPGAALGGLNRSLIGASTDAPQLSLLIRDLLSAEAERYEQTIVALAQSPGKSNRAPQGREMEGSLSPAQSARTAYEAYIDSLKQNIAQWREGPGSAEDSRRLDACADTIDNHLANVHAIEAISNGILVFRHQMLLSKRHETVKSPSRSVPARLTGKLDTTLKALAPALEQLKTLAPGTRLGTGGPELNWVFEGLKSNHLTVDDLLAVGLECQLSLAEARLSEQCSEWLAQLTASHDPLPIDPEKPSWREALDHGTATRKSLKAALAKAIDYNDTLYKARDLNRQQILLVKDLVIYGYNTSREYDLFAENIDANAQHSERLDESLTSLHSAHSDLLMLLKDRLALYTIEAAFTHKDLAAPDQALPFEHLEAGIGRIASTFSMLGEQADEATDSELTVGERNALLQVLVPMLDDYAAHCLSLRPWMREAMPPALAEGAVRVLDLMAAQLTEARSQASTRLNLAQASTLEKAALTAARDTIANQYRTRKECLALQEATARQKEAALQSLIESQASAPLAVTGKKKPKKKHRPQGAVRPAPAPPPTRIERLSSLLQQLVPEQSLREEMSLQRRELDEQASLVSVRLAADWAVDRLQEAINGLGEVLAQAKQASDSELAALTPTITVAALTTRLHALTVQQSEFRRAAEARMFDIQRALFITAPTFTDLKALAKAGAFIKVPGPVPKNITLGPITADNKPRAPKDRHTLIHRWLYLKKIGNELESPRVALHGHLDGSMLVFLHLKTADQASEGSRQGYKVYHGVVVGGQEEECIDTVNAQCLLPNQRIDLSMYGTANRRVASKASRSVAEGHSGRA